MTLLLESKSLFLKNPATRPLPRPPNWGEVIRYCIIYWHTQLLYISLSHNNTILSKHRGVEWLFCVSVCSFFCYDLRFRKTSGSRGFKASVGGFVLKEIEVILDSPYLPQKGATPSGLGGGPPPPGPGRPPGGGGGGGV